MAPARHISELDRKLIEADSIWSYLPNLLLYPLRGVSLFVIMFFGALAWAFSISIIIFSIYLLFFSVALLHYFFSILENTIYGRGSPPDLGSSEFFNLDGRPEKLTTVAFLYLTVAGILFANEFHALANVIGAISFFLLPACAVLVAVHEPFWIYGNPYHLASFALAAGPGYWLFAGIFAIGATFVLDVLALTGISVWEGSPADLLFSPRSLQSMVVFMFTLYFSYLLAHMLGFIIHHRHEELNIKPLVRAKSGDERQNDDLHDHIDRLWNRVDRAIRSKNLEEAKNILMRDEGPGENLHLYHEELFERTCESKVGLLIFNQGRRLIDFMVREKRFDRALDIVELCLDKTTQFEAGQPEVVVKLANMALTNHRYALFERILGPAMEWYVGKPEFVDLVLLKTRYLVDVKSDETGALAELERLDVDRSHPLKAKVEGLINALRNILNR